MPKPRAKDYHDLFKYCKALEQYIHELEDILKWHCRL